MKTLHDAPLDEHVGRSVSCFGHRWKITAVCDWLDCYEIERFEQRPNGLYKIGSTCVLGLSEDHPHYASLIDEEPPHER